jgi:hypothetical protein
MVQAIRDRIFTGIVPARNWIYQVITSNFSLASVFGYLFKQYTDTSKQVEQTSAKVILSTVNLD